MFTNFLFPTEMQQRLLTIYFSTGNTKSQPMLAVALHRNYAQHKLVVFQFGTARGSVRLII